MSATHLHTERLLLRPLEPADFEPMSAMMADEEVARFIGGVQSKPLCWRAFCCILGHWQLRGYGFFSVIEKQSGAWLGRIGPWYPHGWPQPEIGWTLNRDSWGKGYATEAAAACMDHAFDTLGWDTVIHLIDSGNTGSQRVASRLGSIDSGDEVEVAGFGIKAAVWGQSATDWAVNRDRLAG